MRTLFSPLLRVLSLPMLFGGASCTCEDLGCLTGLKVDVVLETPGAWEVSLTADGSTFICTGEVPFSGLEDCDSPLSWGLVGAGLPAEDQYVDGLTYYGTATSVSLVIKLDGVPVHEETFIPDWRDYQLGNDVCGAECTAASVSLGAL